MTRDSLFLPPSSFIISVVGAGGKTTLCWQLVAAALGRGQRVVFTTTTKIWRPALGAFDVVLIEPDITAALTQLQQGEWRSACIAAGELDMGGPQPPPNSPDHMPVLPQKLRGYAPAAVCAAAPYLPADCQLIIEADGARGALVKAPAEHEPMIPACTDVVCVVANRNAIGQPLGTAVAHRPERIAQLTGLALGDIVTDAAFLALLSHPLGGLKGIPPRAECVKVITSWDETSGLLT